jgi:hypothetical protein
VQIEKLAIIKLLKFRCELIDFLLLYHPRNSKFAIYSYCRREFPWRTRRQMHMSSLADYF